MAIAKLKYARMSAQKVRLVADQIRGSRVGDAINFLTFCTKKASRVVKKILRSAIANAEINEGLDIDELKISKIFIDKAASFKRFEARARGRSNRIERQSCHITIEVK